MDEMRKGKCERCGKRIEALEHDYCAVCSRDLCEECMARGCCGNIPARPGLMADYAEEISQD